MTDEVVEAHYRRYDPQHADIEAEERACLNDAIDEFCSSVEVAIAELQAIKNNFTTRRFNQIVAALEDIKETVEEMKEEVDE